MIDETIDDKPEVQTVEAPENPIQTMDMFLSYLLHQGEMIALVGGVISTLTEDAPALRIIRGVTLLDHQTGKKYPVLLQLSVGEVEEANLIPEPSLD